MRKLPYVHRLILTGFAILFAFSTPIPAQEKSKKSSAATPTFLQPTPQTMTMPKDGGTWPAIAPMKSALRPTDSVNLSTAMERGVFVRSIVIGPASRKAVVLATATASAAKIKPALTRVIYCNLAESKILGEWSLNTVVESLDMHDDGDKILARRSEPGKEDADKVELWTFPPSGKLSRKKWLPGIGEITWAGFLNKTYIASIGSSGTLKVTKLDPFKTIAEYSPVTGQATVTPDGSKLVFLTAGKVAIYDPIENKVIATKPFAKGSEQSALLFHPTGRLLACAQNGRVDVLDLRSGQSSVAMFADLKFRDYRLIPGIGWVGSQNLYHEGDLYDPSFPIAAWKYNGAEWEQPVAGMVWALLRSNAEDGRILRAFEIPHAYALAEIRKSKEDKSLFNLRPGDGVSIDVSGLPADKQKEIRASLDRRMKQLGYRIVPSSPIVLEAWEEKLGIKKSITYTFSRDDVETFTYTYRPANLQIRKESKVLWKQTAALNPPMLITFRPNVKHLTIYGGPDYSLFTERSLPAVLSSEKTSRSHGTTYLKVDGMSDPKPFSERPKTTDKAKKDWPKRERLKIDKPKKKAGT